MEDTQEICYSLQLTGSVFFDRVLMMRAMELKKNYPGLEVTADTKKLTIAGRVSASDAAALRQELGCRDMQE